jgi:hypothetical protein
LMNFPHGFLGHFSIKADNYSSSFREYFFKYLYRSSVPSTLVIFTS